MFAGFLPVLRSEKQRGEGVRPGYQAWSLPLLSHWWGYDSELSANSMNPSLSLQDPEWVLDEGLPAAPSIGTCPRGTPGPTLSKSLSISSFLASSDSSRTRRCAVSFFRNSISLQISGGQTVGKGTWPGFQPGSIRVLSPVLSSTWAALLSPCSLVRESQVSPKPLGSCYAGSGGIILGPGTPNITGPSNFCAPHLPTQLEVWRDCHKRLFNPPWAQDSLPPALLATYFCW